MFPASFKKIKTTFTFQVLDDFLTDNRECKTAAMNYFNKLRRLTSNTFPHTVPVRRPKAALLCLSLNQNRTGIES